MVTATDETKTPEADPTPKGQDSPKGDESNSQAVTKTYTQEEVQKRVEDAIAQYGDRIKRDKIDPIIKERDALKAQVDASTVSVEETKGRIAELEADLETAIGDNVDLAEVQKLKKELKAEKAKLTNEVAAKQKALDAEREQWASTVAEAQAMQLEADYFEVAEEYEGGDSERLKAICERAGAKKREDIQGLADVLWTKKGKSKEAKGEPLIPDSSVTHGGGVNLAQLMKEGKADELLKIGFRKNK